VLPAYCPYPRNREQNEDDHLQGLVGRSPLFECLEFRFVGKGKLLIFVDWQGDKWQNQYTFLQNPACMVLWNVTGDQILIELRLNTTAWMGFGLHDLNSDDDDMNNADIYTVYWSPSGEVIIEDQFTTGPPPPKHVPQTDAEQGCTNDIIVSLISFSLTYSPIRLKEFKMLLLLTSVSPDLQENWIQETKIVIILSLQEFGRFIFFELHLICQIIYAVGRNNSFVMKHLRADQVNFDLVPNSNPTQPPTTQPPTTPPPTKQPDQGKMKGFDMPVVLAIVFGIVAFLIASFNVIFAYRIKYQASNHRRGMLRVNEEKDPLLR
jgi:hypothetical protein